MALEKTRKVARPIVGYSTSFVSGLALWPMINSLQNPIHKGAGIVGMYAIGITVGDKCEQAVDKWLEQVGEAFHL